MHYQHKNPFRERDHQLSLLPLEPTPPPRTWAEIIAWCALYAGLVVGAIWFCWRISL